MLLSRVKHYCKSSNQKNTFNKTVQKVNYKNLQLSREQVLNILKGLNLIGNTGIRDRPGFESLHENIETIKWENEEEE